jgi:hypothetical protein
VKLYFATIFDNGYLSRGLLLHETIAKHHTDFELYIVCLDDEVYSNLQKRNLTAVTLIKREDIENEYPELATVKQTRNPIDYIFTLSPYYPSYILKKYATIPFICSLDCDQYFFANTEFVFKDLESHSVLVMPHKFTPKLIHLENYGKFNVSFQAFKNDKIGNECLALWRADCLASCSDVLTDTTFADQKYLDKWPTVFSGAVKSIENIGMGLAPWNLGDKEITCNNDTVFVNNEKLILYHYQGLRIVHKNLINSGLSRYAIRPSKGFIKCIMRPVINGLIKFSNNLAVDYFKRNELVKKNLFSYITTKAMFYKMGNRFISMNPIFRLKGKPQMD